jgi:glycosyltransferase involved in cell wall biosynthesis
MSMAGSQQATLSPRAGPSEAAPGGISGLDSPGKGPISFFLPSLRGGGAERVTINLLQGLAERGYPVDLVLVELEGALVRQIPAGVRVIDLRAPRVLRSILPLARYLREERPRALISSMHHANVIALLAASLSRQSTPVLVTVHTTLSQKPRRALADALLWPQLIRILYRKAKAIVAVSEGAADDLARTARIPREQIQVIYNPVITPAMARSGHTAPDHAWFAPGQPPVVLGVGRLTWAKDFPTLIRAFAEIRRERPARLMILGEGEERPALEAIVQELGVSSEVSLPGFQADALAYMANSSVFVLSSVTEALPTVLVEALAMGARVVATDCPSGPREILQQGRLGRLVPVGDERSMATAILGALDQPEKVPLLDSLTPFTRDAAVGRYLRLIESAQ